MIFHDTGSSAKGATRQATKFATMGWRSSVMACALGAVSLTTTALTVSAAAATNDSMQHHRLTPPWVVSQADSRQATTAPPDRKPEQGAKKTPESGAGGPSREGASNSTDKTAEDSSRPGASKGTLKATGEATGKTGTISAPVTSGSQEVDPRWEEWFADTKGYSASSGKAVYETLCQACHMADGQGAQSAGTFPSFVGNERLRTPYYAVDVVLNGLRGMPGFGDTLSDKQIADVVNHLRSHFGNQLEATLSAEDVARMRPDLGKAEPR